MTLRILTSGLTAFILFLCSCLAASAQVLVSTAGSSHQTQNISWSWSIGETVTQSWFNQDFGITQGFHQPRMYSESSSLPAKDPVSLIVFPNPTSGKISLSGLREGFSFQISLLDPTGQVKLAKTARVHNPELDLGSLPSGLYILRVCCTELSVLIHTKVILQTTP